ncbi:hypothetical protein LH47_02159 [Anoxybacillus thermarum]|uniref:Uncharacterized protein n=1 Tax=Anoxybacillus thermarum TaxID=404937 RepID=A0A0D0RWM9_9BACL|nr:hypothetical protein [Anoxybacillus thermarum]KIQ93770.1 hypothetical protein LH47_02159 [Anoxybacillus thermarum]
MKKRTLFFLLGGLVVVAVFAHVATYFIHISWSGRMPTEHMMGMGKHHRALGHHGPQMMRPHGMPMFGWVPFLIQLALVMIGWIVWKTTKSSGKWIGGTLMAIGLIGLLPKALLAVLAIVAAYVLFRSKTKRAPEFEPFISPIQNHSFLDEWEKTIHKEEK